MSIPSSQAGFPTENPWSLDNNLAGKAIPRRHHELSLRIAQDAISYPLP